MRTLVWLAVCLASVGCRGFGGVREATRRSLRPLPLAVAVQRAVADERPFELELETPVLSGVFDVLCTRDGDGVALQLFPDVGGKVLSMRLGPDGIAAWTPAGDYRATPPLDEAEPHLALVLAMLFAELLAPADGERLRGERGEGGDHEVVLAPAPTLAAGRTVATLGPDGAITDLRVRLGYVEVAIAADGGFAGRGFRGLLSP